MDKYASKRKIINWEIWETPSTEKFGVKNKNIKHSSQIARK